MENLTTQQIDDLWNNRFESEKKSCDGEFDCYNFASRLDGYNYYLSYKASDEIISDSDTITEIEPIVKADLAKMKYQGLKPTMTTENV